MTSIPELALCLHSKGFIRGLHVCATAEIPYMRHSLAEQSRQARTLGGGTREGVPMFDPGVIEANASTILRFLKENCRRDGNTYILRRCNSDRDALQIYDLTTMSTSQQKRWKWLLAMVSHRFALRLGSHSQIGDASHVDPYAYIVRRS
jgi:hypothetical protein